MAELFVMPGKTGRGDTGRRETAAGGLAEDRLASDGLPPDWQEREGALDVRRSWIVEAPAGSGKTGLLIQRYLKLLGDESVTDPGQVLAITFTVKATTEIRERVLGQLEKAARGEQIKTGSGFEAATRELAEAALRRDELLGWGLIEHPRRLNVRTIDSVCAEIARSLPVLSGGGGGLAPVLDASLLYREAGRQTLMQLGGGDAALDEALRVVLLHRDGNLAECELLIANMLEWRDQWNELVPLGRTLDEDDLDRTVLPRLQLALEQAVCAGLTAFAKAVPRDFLEALCRLASSLAGIEPYERERSPIAVCAAKVGLPGTDAADLEHWRALMHLLVTPSGGTWRRSFAKNTMGFETTPHQKKMLKALLEEIAHRDDLLAAIERVNRLPPAVYPREQWVVAKALFRVLSRAWAELQVVFAQRGECDFAELGLLAKSALRREGAVEDLNEALGMKLQHLLVDEMQDTSTSQYELLRLLTRQWDGHSQTVFLVGDPKQSIYLFRQARVERFVRTMQNGRMGDLPLGVLRLTANFRSQSGLVEAFNEDFSLLFPREVSEANPEEVAYVAAEAVNGPTRNEGLGVVWHAHVVSPAQEPGETKSRKRQQSRKDAEEVKAIVRQWRERPLPEGRDEPWKIAVLVRSRGHLLDIVEALKNDKGHGAIPFRAVEIEPLKDRQEVLDLLGLTRALLHPADRVAWLAVLHAPWCGLGLAELHVLAGGDDPAWAERCMQEVIDERADLLSEDSCARLARVWPVLRAATDQRARMTTAQWVERTWRSLGGDAWLTADEMENARRYLRLLDEVEEEAGMLDLGLLQRKIDRLYAESTASAGAVDLMTIHGAKGLEWDVVMVPGLEKKANAGRERLLNWNEIVSGNVSGDEDSAQFVLAPIASKGQPSQELNAWLRGLERAREAAERKRLFYVACTRAREELHLFAAPEMKTNGEISRAAGSLLATAWPAAEGHFADAATVLVMPEAAWREEELVGDLAAGEENERSSRSSPAKLQRLPLGFDPRGRMKVAEPLAYGEAGEGADAAAGAAYFSRPEGSFEARALGNAVHAFLEMLTKRLACGVKAEALVEEIPAWGARIAAVLRGEGLGPDAVDRLSAQVRTALRNALQDAEGLWVLGGHGWARSEYALTAWGEKRSSVRLDRVFRAGEEPLAGGEGCLWIVDYKAAAHGRAGVEEFLAEERVKYGAQMETYARVVRGETRAEVGAGGLRVGLYYPMLARLVWWVPEGE